MMSLRKYYFDHHHIHVCTKCKPATYFYKISIQMKMLWRELIIGSSPSIRNLIPEETFGFQLSIDHH